MFETKELVLHDDVTIQVTIKNCYIIADVQLLFKSYGADKEKVAKFRVNEPYERFMNHVLDCKNYGQVVKRQA